MIFNNSTKDYYYYYRRSKHGRNLFTPCYRIYKYIKISYIRNYVQTILLDLTACEFTFIIL